MADHVSQSLPRWPKHAASMTLTHNNHKDCYQTVAQSIARKDFGYAPDCWVSEAQMRKAVETDECWTLQWHPSSPVGFCLLSAADFDVLIAAAKAADA